MSFFGDDEIQAAWITLLKGNTVLTAEVPAADIKEAQPQTTGFNYPGIRVRVGPNNPGADGCGQEVTIRVATFSEEASSQQATRIAGIILKQYHNKSFSATGLSENMNFTNIKVSTIPVVRQDQRTWRSENIITMLVSG